MIGLGISLGLLLIDGHHLDMIDGGIIVGITIFTMGTVITTMVGIGIITGTIGTTILIIIEDSPHLISMVEEVLLL
ncbi:hypothetical protein N9H35_00490 [bacterium]|nr:hypothetical protein [bacterium]